MVNVTYKDVSKPVLTIQEAIEANSLFKDSYRELETGWSLSHIFHFPSLSFPSLSGCFEILPSLHDSWK